MMKNNNLSETKTLNLKGLFNVSDITGQRFRQLNKKHNQYWTLAIYPKGIAVVLSECVVIGELI